ncbi:MAG: helix-turn-helix domain-containing protein [Chloroflexota bacterium]|nr:MAG: helix-turn-helix domain-containing protein [Chloroflexota bacterium]
MNSRITRREVAKQFIIAIELLLEWIEQKENSNGESTGKDVGEDSVETRLLTAPDVARILNISKGAAYKLIQLIQIPSVRINRNVRVRPEDLDEFIAQNFG